MIARPVVVTLAVVLLSPFVGCAAAYAVRPTTYGGELAVCEAKAPKGPTGWAVYTPCCIDVATRYQRDPLFCFPEDAGSSNGGDQ